MSKIRTHPRLYGKINFIFLVYVPRSGSTLLARQLAVHSSEIIVLPEFRTLEILMGSGESYVKQMSQRDLINIMHLDCQLDNLSFSPEDLTNIAENSCGKGIRIFMEMLVWRYATKRQISPKYAIIKRGDILRFYNQLNPLFPEAKFIHIYRDIRGVTNSTLRGGTPYYYKMGRGDCVYIAKRWVRFMQNIDRLNKSSKKVTLIEVKYEEICQSLQPIKTIAELIGAKFQESPLSFNFEISNRERDIHKLVNKELQLSRLDAWKNELSKWQGIVVENWSYDYLKKLDYEVYFVKNVSAITRMFLGIITLVLHLFYGCIYNGKRLLFYGKQYRLFLIRLRLIAREKFISN